MRVCVVGGGIAGVMAAWDLQTGCSFGASSTGHGRVDVVLVEAAASLGEHATGRSAATLSETSGTREMCALARASRPFFEAPPPGFADHRITGPRGLLWYGRDGDEALLHGIAAVAASGVAPTARRVDASEATSILPILRMEAVSAGGVWEPDARSIDVSAVLHAAARQFTGAGGIIRLGTPLERAAPVPAGGWRVVLGGAEPTTIDVDVIVDAAGAWGDVVAERCGVAPVGLSPLRRTACIVPVDGGSDPDLADAATSWPLAMDVAGRCYFEPEPGGLLVSPADETTSAPVDARAEEEDVAWGIEMLHEATTLQVRTVRSVWAGLRTFASDRVPVLGPDPDRPGFVWLVGQGGAGIKTAPAMAAATSSVVLGSDWPAGLTSLGIDASALSPARFR